MAYELDSERVRTRVDAHADQISAKRSDLRALYEHFGMPDAGTYSLYEITRWLAKRASDCFQAGHGQAQWLVRRIQDDLIYDHILEQKPLDPYFVVLEHLRDALLVGVHASPSTVAAPVDGDWLAALDCACDSVLVHDWTNAGLRESTYGRTYHVARAALRLRSLNVTLMRSQHAVGLDDESDLRVAGLVEDTVRRHGGMNVARRLFEQITPLYQPQQERYQLIRQVGWEGKTRPHIPFGHLALIAEKHATSHAEVALSPQGWNFLCQLSSDYAAILDVQPYTQNFSIRSDPTFLPRHLQEVAIYDSVFTLPQLRPSDLIDMIVGMLDGIDPDERFGGSWSIHEATEVICMLLQLSKDIRGPVVIDRRQLERMRPEIPRATLISILDEVLSHAPQDVNPNYCRPTDGQSAATFSCRPLIKRDSRRYVLIDRSLCSPNCIEALFTPLRAKIENFDTVQVGPAIERFLEKRLQLAGIMPRSGTYHIGHQVRECDLVVETADTVILIELKKKPLTFPARFGSDVNLLIDLADSVVKALLQSGRHEHELRKAGHLDLTKNGETYRLELGGRHVERIAVSLFDFGGFQDRVFVDGFLNVIRAARFHPINPAHAARLNAFNKSIDKLNQQLSCIEGLGVDVSRPFFHCWFLSLPQLMVIMDDVTNAEEFKQSLWTTRHFTSGASDSYFEHAYMKNLKAAAAASSPPQ